MSGIPNIQEMTREERLVTQALYHLSELKEKDILEGGNICLTEQGRATGKAIADTNEFTSDEIAAAAILVMRETGGIEHA